MAGTAIATVLLEERVLVAALEVNHMDIRPKRTGRPFAIRSMAAIAACRDFLGSLATLAMADFG